MNTSTAKSAKTKAKRWIDNQGREIPTARITALEKLKEKTTSSILAQSKKMNKQLAALKAECHKQAQEIIKQHNTENFREGAKAPKGNISIYNFDRSIKLEVSVNDNLSFDDLNIQACKEILLEMIDDSVNANDELVKELVMDAFTTSRGQLDTKKVTGLLKYKSKIKDPRYAQAMELLEKAMSVDSSRVYYRIWERDPMGKYQNIDLNFSSIEIKA